MDRYICPVCGKQIRGKQLGSAVHNHYLRQIGKKFLDKGFLVIQEGKILSIPENWYDERFENIKVAYKARDWKNVIRKWREPDLIVLDVDKMTKVIEVLGTAEDYRILAAKIEKINRFLMPPETIVFNAVNYVDRFLDEPRRKKLAEILGFQPCSYREVDQYYHQILEEEYGLKFTLWSEEDLGQNII